MNAPPCSQTSAEPFGVLAALWDDLEASSSSSNVFAKRIDADQDPANPVGHWIVQWHQMQHFLSSGDLNFQIKLFDDGVIEIHYATLLSPTNAANAVLLPT